ncbi:MAG: hypothetical protein HYY49_06460 [Ignavibacteriales bacterium]|nr:hypothetical protein [Ignavibacteriales bacterium]
MDKRLWMGFIAVFVTLEITAFLVNGLLLASTYESLKSLWREDMMSKMWIYHVITLIGSFFFTLVFSKGYEGKGMMEGVRYGAYIGIWLSVGMAYGTYASIAIPYSLALQWFLYGVVEYIIAGVVLATVFAKVAKAPAA